MSNNNIQYSPLQDEGVAAVKLAVSKMKWIFRAQPVADIGIDGHIEILDDGSPTGKLIFVQVKAGGSFLKEEVSSPNTIIFYGEPKHREYWLSLEIPVCVCIYNPNGGEIYWKEVTHKSVISTGLGWKLRIPKTSQLGASTRESLKKVTYSPPSINLLRRTAGTELGKRLNSHLMQLAQALIEQSDPKYRKKMSDILQNLDVYQHIALRAVGKLSDLGVSQNVLQKVYSWLSDPEIGERASYYFVRGYPVFLIVSADGKPAIWEASDFADYAFLRSKPDADAFILLNNVVNELKEQIGEPPIKVDKHLFYAYHHRVKNVEWVWGNLPENPNLVPDPEHPGFFKHDPSSE